MIIRLTVHDNDFGDVMRLFFRKFYNRLLYEGYGEDLNPSEIEGRAEEINRLINPNSDIVLTGKNKEVIKTRVIETFHAFVDRTARDKAEYLKSSLEVSIIDCLYDKWENSEAWYWLQHSDTCINQ